MSSTATRKVYASAVSAALPTAVQMLSLVRADTGLTPTGVTVPAAFVQSLSGTWTFPAFADPQPGLVYNYYYQVTFASGQYYTRHKSIAGGGTVSTANGIATTINGDGSINTAFVLSFKVLTEPGTAGYGVDGDEFDLTSDASGNLQHPFVVGWTYKIWHGSGPPQQFVVPGPPGGSFALPTIIGVTPD